MTTSSLALLLTAGLFTGPSTSLLAQTACPTTPTAIHVAATTLDQALATLARHSGCPIQYEQQVVQPFRSPAVYGTLTPVAAVTQLVRGTGLEVHLEHDQLRINQADQQAIGLQAATLQAQLGQAVKAQTLPQSKAQALYTELAQVRTSVVELAKEQGFVSAAEKASYQRTFAYVQQIIASVQ